MQLGWHLNRFVCRHPWLLNVFGARLTVTNLFRSPGDTLLTAMVCRIVKERHPRIRINCRVDHPELLAHDPAIDTLNGPEGRWRTEFEYLVLLERKDADTQVLAPALSKLGIKNYKYKASVFLTPAEMAEARKLLGPLEKPVVTFNAMSREAVKVWPLKNWTVLLRELAGEFSLVQLGDKTEPAFDGVISFAGKLSMRQSMAVLALAQVHIGPDSFLMHAANGLDVPSVIVFGGSRTDRTLGYAKNENLYERTDCSPCWLHTTKGERCDHNMKCMEAITPERVLKAFRRALAKRSTATHNS